MFKGFLSTIDRNRKRIIKFFILCSTVKFIISLMYRLYTIKESRTQFESTTNLYSLFIVCAIFLHEFIPCFMCDVVTENFKAITNYKGKGILFILVSIIYMSPSMDDQNNYSSYLLFLAGTILLIADRNRNSDNSNQPISSGNFASNDNKASNDLCESSPITSGQRTGVISINLVNDSTPPKKTLNPYEIPDDF